MDYIRETTELRRDLDELLQRIKNSNPLRSFERSMVTTRLQEAIMWLEMDLKAIGANVSTLDPIQQAHRLYHEYATVTDFKNHRGEPMPAFDDLPNLIKQAWIAVGKAGYSTPHSYNPDSSVIEPDADGLTL